MEMESRSLPMQVKIEDEIKKSYLDYAMSVIIGRALPDIRDGLKPVHRRVLYAMYKEGLLPPKKHSKCAGVVGEVLKKYHPHGDAAVYDALVRMGQDFNMRYPLIDGQGNFGSIDGDPPAAYRYTEARLSKIAVEMMQDIDKDTVDFVPNFDETTEEPSVLPTRIPNLLINGSSGIAVGMSTSIPPHNLNEVLDALILLVQKPDATIDELMQKIQGPDFPTGGIVFGKKELKDIYTTGKGIIKIRSKIKIEKIDKGSREAIIVTEIPYQVNKAKLLEEIAELVKNKRIEGISDIRDESNREGIRIVIELKKGEIPDVIVNNLFKHTKMQVSYSVIMLSIVNNQPKILNLKQILDYFLIHRREVILRRTRFDLDKALARAHILEGLQKALNFIDQIINLIKKSENPLKAKSNLIAKYEFSDKQAQAILDMQLQRLTSLERSKIAEELKLTNENIQIYKSILANENLVNNILIDEFNDLKQKYGDKRITKILSAQPEINEEDLIKEEMIVITCTESGYIKRMQLKTFSQQHRGGKGRIGITLKEEDFAKYCTICSSLDDILIFTRKGRVYSLKAYDIPDMAPTAKGRALVNLVKMSPDDKVANILAISSWEQKYLVMLTRNGMIKRMNINECANIHKGGKNSIKIAPNDELLEVKLSNGKQKIFIATEKGKAVYFNEELVSIMGRNASGVRAIKLSKDDKTVGMEIVDSEGYILTITTKGYGKRTHINNYRLSGRNVKGIINIKLSEKIGNVIDIEHLIAKEELLILSASGKVIRIEADKIPILSRATRGVKLMSLEDNDYITTVAKINLLEE
jgi:DNA gyrase subunit A